MNAPALRKFAFTHGGAIAIALLALLIILAGRSELATRHFFWADDWGWLYLAEFAPVHQIASILPRQIYNDRPVGALFIKLVYAMVGLDSRSFLWIQLLIHAGNCVLLYLISLKYVGRPAAMLAAALAGTWIVANSAVFWTAAIFDLLGATLCLLTIWFWQSSLLRKQVLFQLLAALSYFLAIRTKEFALGLPALVFLIGVLLERRTIAQTLRSMAGLLVVMLLLTWSYANLLFAGKQKLVGAQDNLYGLHLDGVPSNLWWYLNHAFYSDVFRLSPLIVAVPLLGYAAWRSAQVRRVIVVCLAGFVVLLGPTLLLTAHKEVLYLYAPHFFLALAVGALVSVPGLSRFAGIAFAAALIVLPAQSKWNKSILEFNDVKSSMIRDQFDAFVRLGGDLPRGASVFVAGLETYHNPFAYGPGHAFRIRQHDRSLQFVIELPEAQLKEQFCKAPAPRYYATFRGRDVTNDTAAAELACAGAPAVVKAP